MDSPVSSSDSNPDRTCFYCNSVATIFKRGWRLRNGGHAMLCNRCGTAFEDGSFCSIFHTSLSGWRECLICDKPIHCGCIVSEKTHVIADFGGVKCKVCSTFEDFVMKKPIASSSVAPEATMVKLFENPSPADLSQKTSGQSAGSSGTKVITDSPAEVQSRKVVVASPRPAIAGSPVQANPAAFSDPRGRERTKLVPDASGWVPLHPRYPLNAGRGVPYNIDSNILVFEKVLNAEDADRQVGRLALPQNCAETCFRKLYPGEEVLVRAQDEGGANWEFSLCRPLKGNNLMYTLGGLGDFMASKQCKTGDKVTIHIEKSGKPIIGLMKGRA